MKLISQLFTPLILAPLLCLQLPVVRAATSSSQDAQLARLAKLVADPHPRVRVEAVRALGKIPTTRSVELVLSAVDTIGTDNFLDYAIWLSVNDLAQPFLTALESGAWVPNSPAKQKQVEFALRALDPALGASSVARLLATKPLTRDGSGAWIELIGTAGGPTEVNRLWEQTVTGGFDDAATVRALTALTQAARLRQVKPAGDGSRAVTLLEHKSVAVRREAVAFLGAGKNPGASFAKMVSLAGAADTAPEVRTALFAAFRELGAIPPVLGALQPLAAKTAPAPVRSAAATTLASLQPAKFASLALEVLAETKSDAEALDLWRSLLTAKGMAKQLAPYVGTAQLPPAIALAGLRAAREGGQPDPALIAALNKQSNVALSPDKLTPERLKEIADIALKSGDAARGERIYRRAELGCVLCHSIGGVGGKVGPDMTSLGASAPADYLVESVLVPNAKIKEGFHSIIVETKDDLEFSGILVRETGQELILRNAQNQEVSVAKNNVRKRSNGLSLMPSGLVDTLSEGERLDLFRFLTELGKAGNYDASKGGVARVWQVLAGTTFIEQDGFERVVKGEVKQGWKPLLARVSGGLAAEDIAELGKSQADRLVTFYTSTQFTVAKEGPVTFELDGVTKPEVWIDGVKAAIQGASGAKSSLTPNLKPGPHTLVLRLDARQLPEQFKLRCGDVNWAQN